MQDQEWKPSRREQHVLWYLRLAMRYGVGGGGLLWCLATQHLDPTLIMTLGAIATSTDVLIFVRELVRSARTETAQLEKIRRRPAPPEVNDEPKP